MMRERVRRARWSWGPFLTVGYTVLSKRLMLAGVNLALDLSRSDDQFPIRSVGA